MKPTTIGVKISLSWIFLVLSIPLVTGCTSKIKGWNEESFRSAEFDAEKLRKEGLAILPVIVLTPSELPQKDPEGSTPAAPYTPNQSDTEKNVPGETTREAYQLILNKVLTSKLQSRQSPFNLIRPGNALIRLNDETLSCNYQRFNDNFTKTGLDPDQLKCFGTALNCRYLFISQATVSEQKSEASVTIIWTFGRKSLLRSVKVYGQVWDTQNGMQIWESSGVGYHNLSAYEASPLVEQMAEKAVERLLITFMP
jgi:hypothetical protein